MARNYFLFHDSFKVLTHVGMDEAWVVRNKLISVCEDVGFVFITIDLRGFKSGSMNIVLKGQNSAYEHG